VNPFQALVAKSAERQAFEAAWKNHIIEWSVEVIAKGQGFHSIPWRFLRLRFTDPKAGDGSTHIKTPLCHAFTN